MLADLIAWAEATRSSRPPDFTIGPANDPQVHRWFAVPRNPFANVYVHEFFRSDPDAPHDHPWDNRSVILRGSYEEEDLDGIAVLRSPGDVVERRAETAHRVVLASGAPPVLTLFTTGPVRRSWGFYCPRRWVPWREFVAARPGGNERGAGCGE